MVDSGRGRRQRRRDPVISPVLRPMLWSALLGAVAAAVLAAPAYAEPGVPVTVPDSGSRPTVSSPLLLPGGVAAPGLPGQPAPGVAAPATDPLQAQITAVETRIGQLGTQLLQLEQQRTEAETQLRTAERDLEFARDALTGAQRRADTAAAQALKAAAALPPGEFATDLRDLTMLQRLHRGDRREESTNAAASQLTRARTDEQTAYQAYLSAESRAKGIQEQYAATEKALRAEEAKLLKLREEHSARLVELARQQEAVEQQLGAGYLGGESVDGLAAHPTALAALAYAKRQLGDPYLWAAEGPDRFDCSGLIWAAYRSAGYYDLPRVSRDQYYATRSRTVARNALLPGDLVFFASGSSWTSIHHMGMYIGGGKMIHAPTTGDVVKISTVSWSRLYAATRVVGAVPAPSTPPKPKPKPTPKPTPSKPTTPTPTPTGKPKPTPTTPSPTPSPTDSPSPSPSGSTSPSPTGQASPSGSAVPTASASASLAPSGSASPSASGSTSPLPKPTGQASPSAGSSPSVGASTSVPATTAASSSAGPETSASTSASASTSPTTSTSASPSASTGS
ncbi:NlpC/P60 family protein [Micromonospora nigra]|uniref:NlpC/P60 family protein n=1 Tax=Micromonospora nigra TaxID=145857 RepID=A0A1C6S491_9ACTN|nr:C40 family peptidase [Micromonospora nigra]SCL24207.1 NlpC/P60 family protein [Micromonospora nigra]